MFQSLALLQRNAGFPVTLPLVICFAAACGADSQSGLTYPLGGESVALVLGSAATFAVLGGPAATCTRSTITGDVGAGFPGAPVTQSQCTITGTIHAGDAIATQAYNDFLKAYLTLGAMPCPADPAHNLSGTLAGRTLGPGVYCFAAAAKVTGLLTLDAYGDPLAVWNFKIGSGPQGGALTGTDFSVVMANGGQPCNVSWWVADAATMTTANLKGSVLAGADSTFTGPGSIVGRALAKAGVTLTDISPLGGCSVASSGPGK